jgi:hypothetical protein
VLLPEPLGPIRPTTSPGWTILTVTARLDRVPADPRIPLLLPRYLAGAATPGEATPFQSLWQGRVRMLLVERVDDPDVIVIQNR